MLTVPKKSLPEIQTAGLPNVTQRIDTPEGMFGDGGKALLDGADALDKLGASLDKRALDLQGEKNAARALELKTMAKREAMAAAYDPQNGILTKKGGNALGSQAEMAKVMGDIKKKYSEIQGDNPAVRDLVSRDLVSLEDSMLDTTLRHEFGEFQSYKSEQLAAVQTANIEDVAFNFNDEKNFSKKWEENLKALTAQATQEGFLYDSNENGLDTTKKGKVFEEKKKELYSQMRSAQITAMLNQGRPDDILKAKEVYDEAQGRGMITLDDSMKLDKVFDVAVPEAAAQKVYMGLGVTAKLTSEEDILNYVVDELEGGDKLAQEPKGGVAKFGINSIANPDVKVKELTRDDAMKLYKDRYWNAIGANELPESIRFIAFDTAVNHGVGKAKELIKEANGNPKVLIELRYKEYLRLAKENPAEYAKFLPSWKNRLAEVSKNLTSNPDSKTVEAAAAQLDLEYSGAGEQLLNLHKKTQDQIESARKVSQNQFLDSVMPRLYKNNGDWSVLTPQERATAIELDVWKDVTSFTGRTNPAVGTAIAQMPPEEILSTDFSQGQWRANLSQTDYESIIKKQTDLREKPSARGEFRTTRDVVSQAWKSTGKKVDDPDYYVFQGAVEDAFASEIEARGGKQLSADEKRAIVSKLVMNTSVGAGFFDGAQKKVYQLDPEETYQISGQDPEIVGTALNILVNNNIEPTQKNVAQFIEKPSDFIKVEGYNEADIANAVQALMRNGAPVSTSTVKSLLERRKNG